MSPDPTPFPPSEAARTIDEVAARAARGVPGSEGDAPARPEDGLEEVRAHIAAAGEHVDAGTERDVDPGARGQLRRAALRGLRPVTDHQVAFNRELSVAVDRLTSVVEDLLPRLASLGLDDDVADLGARLEDLERTVADQRRLLATTRAREDVVLRAAIRTVEAEGAPNPAEATASTLAHESRRSLRRRLGAAGRPSDALLTRWADELSGWVKTAADAGPVLDLASDRGEWLDAWRAHDLDAQGVEPESARAALLAERGHRVEVADPATALHGRDPATLGGVTAATLADVVDLDELVEVLDGAAAALVPGGVLVLAAAHPLSLAWADPQWADPRRRPLHPATAEALAFDRGFAEAQVVELTDSDERGPAIRSRAARRGDPTSTTPDSERSEEIVRHDQAPSAEVVRAYALVARTASGPSRS